MPTAKSKSLHEEVSPRISARLWEHSRLLVALIVGLLVSGLAPLDGAMTRILAAWNAAGWLYITLLGVMMFRCEIDGIRQQASLEEESRFAILILTILASAAMMVASGAQLSGLSRAEGSEAIVLFGLSFSTILVSWFLVHFVFALYYAHEFHSKTRRTGGAGAGFDFHGQKVRTISISSTYRWSWGPPHKRQTSTLPHAKPAAPRCCMASSPFCSIRWALPYVVI